MLALGHYMTNKGTALNHCRTPIEKKRKTDSNGKCAMIRIGTCTIILSCLSY